MNTYTENLKTYLAEHPLKYETNGADSLVHDLFWYFSENNPPVNERIRSLADQAESYFSHFTSAQKDALFGIFTDLCMQQEQLAFQGGLRMGTQLMLDLFEK